MFIRNLFCSLCRDEVIAKCICLPVPSIICLICDSSFTMNEPAAFGWDPGWDPGCRPDPVLLRLRVRLELK